MSRPELTHDYLKTQLALANDIPQQDFEAVKHATEELPRRVQILEGRP